MSRTILVIGESGAGKTTSTRTLDPKHTLYIDCDGKGLNWKGWKSQYNAKNKNYVATSNAESIRNLFNRASTQDLADNVNVIVVDTLNAIMVDDEFKRMHEKNYDKWADLAFSIYDLVDMALQLRDGLTVVFMAHSQTDRDDNGYMFTRMKTSGRKLDKIVVESKFTTVLLAKASEGKYVFETHAAHSTAKTPYGLFKENEIPNDLSAVIKALDEYEK